MTNSDEDFRDYLQETEFLNYNHPSVIDFFNRYKGDEKNLKNQAVSLYLAVRDEIRYNPYFDSKNREVLKASGVINAKEGFCVSKAVLYAALLRKCGIPGRLGFADVKNHLSTKRFIEMLRTDIFYFHGYTEAYLDHKWVKATPAFHKRLCKVFHVEPLEFTGERDSIFQEYSKDGSRYMEYLSEYGTFADLPVELMTKVYRKHYAHLMDLKNFEKGDMETEALEEYNLR